jgi:hypothetical protein
MSFPAQIEPAAQMLTLIHWITQILTTSFHRADLFRCIEPSRMKACIQFDKVHIVEDMVVW